MIRVKVYRDGQSIHKVDLSGDDLIIGREAGADIQLQSPAVSRRHARLQKTAEGWQVADMGAANGVYVSKDGGEPERVVIEPVAPGDVIIIETFSIKFEEVAEGGDVATPRGPAAFDENSLETKRTQFISMVEVLEAGEGALRVPTSAEGEPEISGKSVRPVGGGWWVRMQSSQGHDRTFEVGSNQIAVGSAEGCLIRLPSGPGRIVELERSGPSVSLARVGKWPFPRVVVDGASVKNAVLSDGDSFTIGDVEVSVHLREAPGKA